MNIRIEQILYSRLYKTLILYRVPFNFKENVNEIVSETPTPIHIDTLRLSKNDEMILVFELKIDHFQLWVIM